MKTLLAVLFVLVVIALPAYSQLSSGSILGTVSDPTGAVIPGVSIKVTNVGTGLVRETLTNESGNYRLDLLPRGDYQIEAELAGFKKGVRRGVTVSIDERVRIDFTLVVGEVSEVINVEGQAPPWVLRQRLATADGITLANPWGNAPGSTISASGRTYIQPNVRYANWNLDVQREMPGAASAAWSTRPLRFCAKPDPTIPEMRMNSAT